MRVFIGNISCITSSAELRFMLYKCLSRSMWRQFKLAVIYRFDVRRDVILKIVRKPRRGSLVCYGIAEFSQPEVGQMSIHLLNRYVWSGKTLVAHEFVHRTYANERRAVGSRDKRRRGAERRRHERRDTRPAGRSSAPR